MKHASIVPLIGGMPLASDQTFGSTSKYLLSYDVFGGNDSHLRNYYEFKNQDVPYHVLDKEHSFKSNSDDAKVDVISSTCPCAGLSTMSHTSGADNPLNEWMATTAQFVLGEVKPQVYWGENAPTFAGNTGKKIRDRIYNIGRDNGYTMTIYRTKSLLHGLPQVRQRSFYFFWKEADKVPILDYYRREYTPIKDFVLAMGGNSQQELTNEKDPLDNPYYRYILEVMWPGMSHSEFTEQLDKSYELTGYIRSQGVQFPELANYFRERGLDKEADKCLRRQAKLDSGGGIMTRALYIPKNYTGAFVGHLPRNMTHPTETRFLTYRECMGMMKLPEDFELLSPKKNLNHICQNVPITTAADMATEVMAYLDGKRPMVKAKQMLQHNERRKHEIMEGEPKNTLGDHL